VREVLHRNNYKKMSAQIERVDKINIKLRHNIYHHYHDLSLFPRCISRGSRRSTGQTFQEASTLRFISIQQLRDSLQTLFPKAYRLLSIYLITAIISFNSCTCLIPLLRLLTAILCPVAAPRKRTSVSFLQIRSVIDLQRFVP
jgi:hypothetical protein